MNKRTAKTFKKIFRELDLESDYGPRFTKVIPNKKKQKSKEACRKFNIRNIDEEIDEI
jgi:hypothetical protein